jgi:predicted molibdopterin-dependent oxidoreductase YjgC
MPDLLPGYQRVSDAVARQAVEDTWGARLPTEAGLGLAQVLRAAREGRVKAMLLLGDSYNYANGEMEEGYAALERLEFLVVCDSFLGAAAQRAHVVLPAATFAEEEGTYTNLERRVQLSSRALAPRGLEARPAWQVVCQIAQGMAARGFGFSSPAQVFEEIASVSPIYGGVSHQRLIREMAFTLRPDPKNPLPTQLSHSDRVSRGLQWPCAKTNAPGTAVLYGSGFPREKAQLMPVAVSAAASRVSPAYPLLFAPGRVLAQQARDVSVERIGGVNHIQREERVEVHPADAAALGLRAGDLVEVVSAAGRVRGAVEVRDGQHQGVVSMTTLFGEMATRLQASEDPDPMARAPLLAVQPVRLEKAT